MKVRDEAATRLAVADTQYALQLMRYQEITSRAPMQMAMGMQTSSQIAQTTTAAENFRISNTARGSSENAPVTIQLVPIVQKQESHTSIPMSPPVMAPPLKAPPQTRPTVVPQAVDKIQQVPYLDKKRYPRH